MSPAPRVLQNHPAAGEAGSGSWFWMTRGLRVDRDGRRPLSTTDLPRPRAALQHPGRLAGTSLLTSRHPLLQSVLRSSTLYLSSLCVCSPGQIRGSPAAPYCIIS